jgi:hypothetical protein
MFRLVLPMNFNLEYQSNNCLHHYFAKKRDEQSAAVAEALAVTSL